MNIIKDPAAVYKFQRYPGGQKEDEIQPTRKPTPETNGSHPFQTNSVIKYKEQEFGVSFRL